MWYFSPEACLEAAQQAFSTSDDVFGIAKTEDTLGFRQISTARASKNVIQDKDLTWRTFSLAKTNYVRHITKASWPHLHVQSIVDLFFELENHPWRIRLNGERVLLLYLDRVRKEWHTRLALGDGFNIAIINSRLLDEVNDEVWNTSQSDSLMRSVFLISASVYQSLTILFPFLSFLCYPCYCHLSLHALLSMSSCYTCFASNYFRDVFTAT